MDQYVLIFRRPCGDFPAPCNCDGGEIEAHPFEVIGVNGFAVEAFVEALRNQGRTAVVHPLTDFEDPA